METHEEQDPPPLPPAPIAIAGAGIVGLVLALALKKHAGITAELYEQAAEFQDGVGAAIGMYPNGLRVIRDVSQDLFDEIQAAGYPYEYRRWMRHDGTEVAVASEEALVRRDDDYHSLGIQRWKLQRILFDAVVEAGIPIHFSKRVEGVEILRRSACASEDKENNNNLVEISFGDGTSRRCQILLGADGARSKVREFVSASTSSTSKLRYTGTTCLFGLARWPRPERGICFPSTAGSANPTKCHGCFFPINPEEQCFQFHFPVSAGDADETSWGVLSKQDGLDECRNLADRLKQEGWDEQFLDPLRNVSHVVRFGFSVLEPRLFNWTYGPVVLLGDAAHPPVPYLGQGAQMGLEDAGTLAQLVGRVCVDKESDDGSSSLDLLANNFHKASSAFETVRMRRTALVLKNSHAAGRAQQRRANSRAYNAARESSIRFQVQRHGTLPLLLPGVTYDYMEDVANFLLQKKIRQQPELFRFRSVPTYRPPQKESALSSRALAAKWNPAQPPPKLLKKISELSRESSSLSSLVGDDEGEAQQRVEGKGPRRRHRSKMGRIKTFLHPGLSALPAIRRKHSSLAA